MATQTQNKSQNLAAVVEAPKARITTVSRPIPNPGPSELVVRNYAIAANPADVCKYSEHFISLLKILHKYNAFLAVSELQRLRDIKNRC
jgi:hypothetical protein